MKKIVKMTILLAIVSLGGGCGLQFPFNEPAMASRNNIQPEKIEEIREVQRAVEKLPVKVVNIPTLTSVGFASVSVQPGKSLNQKRILAIKAARLDALAKLTEQIHGIQISGSTKISEAIVQNDSLRADIQGVILGARTVQVDPTTSDTFQVTVEIDKSMIDAIVKAYA